MFLVPTLAALFLAGLRVHDGFATISVYQRAGLHVALTDKVSATVDALQAEREAMTAWIAAGRVDGHGELGTRIRATETAASKLRASSGLVRGIHDSTTTERYQQGITRLDSLGQLRADAADPVFPGLAAQESYAVIINALLGISQEFGTDVTDEGLQNRYQALTLLSEAKEYSAQQNSYLHSAAIRGTFDPLELANITTAQSDLLATIARFNAVATPQEQLDYANTVTGPRVSQRFQLQQLALMRGQGATPASLGVDPVEVSDSSAVTLSLIGDVEKRLLDDVTNYTHDLVGVEHRALTQTSAAIIGLLAFALALMYVVGRSLLRPLRQLRNSALEMVEVHLPHAVDRIMREADPAAAAEKAIEHVAVYTTEEIGQVARAFDLVNTQAVRMATEQALLRKNVSGIFVNLSRRSQRLVERQLSLIDRLESDEPDPDNLASLFELDHLATQLRRNGESLLVLSGAGLSKAARMPVPTADVIGAAVSESEQYARVEVGTIPEVTVRGPTVHNLVHVLAELLDNAAYFSEPETVVSVRAVLTRKDALAIQITDRGIGMTDEQLIEANTRLADPPDLDYAVTRRMGLYVVARLAQRHGILVRLRENEDAGGIIARILVPAEQIRRIEPSERTADTVVLEEDTVSFTPLAMPVGQPEYKRVDSMRAAQLTERVEPVLDEMPTGRLPVCDAILSRWFADVEPAPDELAMPEEQTDSEVGWPTASDEALEATRSLLEVKEEEITATGLPKRVPNVYLVTAPTMFETSGDQPIWDPSPKSATAVRSRMASLQRGCKTGRHALLVRPDSPAADESVRYSPPGTSGEGEG